MELESTCIPEAINSFLFGDKNKGFENILPPPNLSDIKELIESNQYGIDFFGIFGFSIFILIYFNTKKRNTLIQKLLSICWIALGYKFYLENSIYKLFSVNSSFSLILGIINISIGILLYVNFIELYKLKENWSQNSLSNNFKSIFNFVFINFSHGFFDLDKLMMFDINTHFLKIGLNYLFVTLNTFPLMSNLFIKKKIFNIPFSNFPSPVGLATLTIFLNYFRNTQFTQSNILIAIDILCYLILILNFLNDVIFLKLFTFENIFFLILNILNLIVFYYLDTCNLNGLNINKTTATIEEKRFYGYERLHIEYKHNGDGGIQGFSQAEFFIDNFGTIANSFLVFSSKSLSLIQDISVRPIKLDQTLVKYVYPLYSA